MAISRTDFEKGNFRKRVYSRTEHPVFKLLAAHPQQAFTIHEISRVIKMKEETIRSMLRELIKDGVVVHRQPYWAIKNRKQK